MTTYNIVKLDNRYLMHKKYGFECMVEWDNIPLVYDSRAFNDFYLIQKVCVERLGVSWSQYFNYDGKWRSERERYKTKARIYFQKESYLLLVQLAL